MASHSDDKGKLPTTDSSVDSRSCRECDTFGEDRCSIHAHLCASTGPPSYKRMPARYAGTCSSCSSKFAKDDIIFWAPERKPICDRCGPGGDKTCATERILAPDQRITMIRLLDTMQAIENASRPWDDSTQDQFETTLAALYGQFRNVSKVKICIERHMNELNAIPARQGMKHSRPLVSKRPDVCRVCNKHTERGELIWWSPSEPLMCFDCGRGKDAEEAALSNDDRAKMSEMLQGAKFFEELGDACTVEQRSEYDALLVNLYSRFRKIIKVKRLLVKHMESLKAIAARQGPGNKRTVISKQEHTCKSCNRTIGKGEVLWWSPDEHRLCFDCGQNEDESAQPDNEQVRRARELLEQLKRLDEQTPSNLPPAWAAKLLDEREDVLIELYCDLRHLEEVRVILYDHFTELCAIASKANAG